MRQFILGFLVVLTFGTQAQSVREVVPAAAPRGARVIVAGSQLDGSGIAVTFSGSGGARVPAVVATRNARFVEVTVPERAVTGRIAVTSGSSTIGNPAFSVAPDVAWTSITTIARASESVGLKQPEGIAVDPISGNVFIADTNNHQIKVLSPSGTLSVLAGSGKPGFHDGLGIAAELKEPRGVAFDAARKVLYVADSGNHVIRRITLAGAVTTIAGSGQPGADDAIGSAASFKRPVAVAVDEQGDVFVADTDNHEIRKVTLAGAVTTVAGTGRDGYAEGPASSARLAGPEGVAVTGGVVFFADTGNHRIRKIEGGIVSLVAGDGTNGFVDGTPEQARFDRPSAVAVDEGGTIFVADGGNGLVRKIAQGIVSTIAGRTDGPRNDLYDGPPLDANLHQLSALAFAGALYLADTKNDAARLLEPELRLSVVYPRRGSLGGGNEVRLLGAGFIPGITEVKIGSTVATNVTYVTSTLLVVTMPPGAGGATDITVSRLGDAVTLAAGYLYLPPPTIVSIAPNKGKTAGGQSAIVRGTDFMADETDVFFGTAAAPQVVVDNPTSATVTTPAGSVGAVDLLARTPAGEARLQNAFRFFAPPVLTGFAPPSGYPGTAVTIAGSNFDTDASGNVVRFGTLTAPTVTATATSINTVVPAGASTGRISVTTAGGTASSATDFVVPVLTALTVTPPSVVLQEDETRQFSATGRWSDGTSRDVTSQVTWTSSNASVASVNAAGLVRAESSGTATITASLEGIAGTGSVKVEEPETLPPSTVDAPPLSEIEITPMVEATAFLYSGPGAVQTGVASNAINPERSGVVRGKATTRAGSPLAGVRVTIKDAPQYGGTMTREDGYFDMAVNGGRMIVTYEKDGYLPVQRVVSVPLQDYLLTPEVVMIPLDDTATVIEAGSASQQLARGSMSEDASGRRQATLIFPAQTGVSIVMPDGSTRTLPSLTVRATEYTVGANGPQAMPAALPPTTGYTYCVELSADEAVAVGATDVKFTKPIALYVENFLGFPVGGIVPAGYLDRKKGVWIPSNNGRVIKVLTVSGALATIDITGDGAADDTAALAALGIDDAERQRLATLYAAGTSLWRVPITHFTPWDCNWPYGPPSGATAPEVPPPTTAYWIAGGRSECGSMIDCHNQTLGESISIPGVPFPLVYSTNRIPSDDHRTLNLQISGPTVPAKAKRFQVEIEYGGRKIVKTYSVAPSVHDEIKLDLRDAYGRALTGGVRAQVRIGYVYDAEYQAPSTFDFSFGSLSGIPITANRAAGEITLNKESSLPVSTGDVRPLGVQGWSLGNHQVYDFGQQTLFQGNGSQRTSLQSDARSHVLRTIAGTGKCCGDTVNGPARSVNIHPLNFRIGPSGDIYLNEWDWVRKVDRSGNITVVAGTRNSSAPYTDGPALERQVSLDSIAIGPDGTLYLNENSRIRKVVNGMLVTVAGEIWTTGNTGDGGPATAARINAYDISVGPDSSIYILQRLSGVGGRTIRRIFPNGIIQTIAGGGSDQRNNISAKVAELPSYGIVVDKNETIYLVDSNHGRIRAIGTDGIIRNVAGRTDCSYAQSSGDGGPAVQACLDDPFDVAIDRHGVIYIAEYNGSHIRAVTPDGLITTAAGNGVENWEVVEGGGATGTPVTWPWNVDVDPEGRVYFTEDSTYRVRRIEQVLPNFKAGDQFIASTSGSELYVFNGSRHVRTHDALTQSPLYTFGYDAAGRVSQITDQDGRPTTLERDGSGKLTGVIAPTGERTTLETNAAGQLSSITTAAGAKTQLSYSPEGRLLTMTTPRNHTYRFDYDEDGRLIKDSDPAGGFIRLFKTGSDNDITYSTTTAMGRTKTDRLQRLSNGSEIRTFTSSAGLRVTSTKAYTGSTTTSYPDGTVVSVSEGPDARFGMQAPISGSTVMTTPGGRTWNATVKNIAVGGDLNPTALTTQITLNGRTHTTTYDLSTRTYTARSAAGRQSQGTLDAEGRITSAAVPGLATSNVSYDATGSLVTVVRGARTTRYVYDSLGRILSTTDALGRSSSFQYDAAGRVTTLVLPGGRHVGYGYDGNGNLISVQPPGRPAHLFMHTEVDQTSVDQPPAGAGATSYTYNVDKQLTSITRADGTPITFVYDLSGRITAIKSPTSTLGFGYLANGKVGAITAPGVSLNLTHDGPMVTGAAWSGAVAGSVAWTYDNDFRPTAESVNGSAIAFGYDADSLLTQAGALTLRYDSQNGLLTGTTVDKIVDSYAYNEFGEVTGYSATFNGTPLLSLDYSRDAGGRIAAIGTRGFQYDAAGHLARVTDGGATVAEYSYDDNNNRTEHRWAGGSNAASTDDQDQLLRYGDTTYQYTPNGDLKSKTLAGATTTYELDAVGGLRRVVLPLGKTIEYVIDGQNRRVGKKVNGVPVQGWLYATSTQIVAELDGANNVVSRFVYGSRGNVPAYMIKGGMTYRILSDHVGSPRLVVNAADGTIVQRLDYDEFGRILSDTNPGFQPFGFAGGVFDADTGLVRFGARDYDPYTGRWTSKELLGFGGGDTNLYAYAFGDPINNFDPDGMQVAAANHPQDIAPPPVRFTADLSNPDLLLLQGPYWDQATKSYGESDQCVALTKHFSGAPKSSYWRAGPTVFGDKNIKPGTAIATFVNGRYPQTGHEMNSGIYVSQDSNGIVIIDQWPGHFAQARLLRPKPANTPREDNANAYSVITVPASCECLRKP